MVDRMSEPSRIVNSFEEAKYWGRKDKPVQNWSVNAEDGVPHFHNVFKKRKYITLTAIAENAESARKKLIDMLEVEVGKRGFDCARTRGFVIIRNGLNHYAYGTAELFKIDYSYDKREEKVA